MGQIIIIGMVSGGGVASERWRWRRRSYVTAVWDGGGEGEDGLGVEMEGRRIVIVVIVVVIGQDAFVVVGAHGDSNFVMLKFIIAYNNRL